MAPFHVPVLSAEVGQAAAGSRRAVDATAGGGGHAALLREGGADLLVIDRDPAALAAARERLGDAGVQYRLGRFSEPAVLAEIARFRPDVILLDLGVSGRQLDEPTRGFTFRRGAPLDMRMTPGAGPSAAVLLNTAPETRLAQWFREYGDERRARGLARAVTRRRARQPFAVSDDLVGAVRAALGPRAGPADFARIFQAVRIAVNDELGELERALEPLRDALVAGGRLLVITYHSGEDRLAKRTLADWSRACVCPPGQPVCTCRGRPLGRLPARRGVRPGAAEVAANVRARSARLRTFVKADGA